MAKIPSVATPLTGTRSSAAPSRKTLLLALATLSLLTACVLIASTSYAPSRTMLEEVADAKEAPEHTEAEQAGLGDDEFEDDEEGLDEEMQHETGEEEEPFEDEAEEHPEHEDEEPESEEDEDDEEPEQIEEHEHHHIFHKLAHYASLNPVFKRCLAKAKMPEFSHEITKTCGNIHELQTCAYPCWRAMTMYSDKVGCCFETVLEGYRHLDWYAYHAWRHWQGTLSGKCGITFESDTCGESMGEKPFEDLKDEVGELKHEARMNKHMIDDIKYPYMYFNNGYYGDSAYNKAMNPTHWKHSGDHQLRHHAHKLKHHAHKHHLQMKAEAEGSDSDEHHLLGDEVFDMPVANGEDMGDLHVPAEHLHPYMFWSQRQPEAGAEEPEEEEEEEEEDDGSHRKGSMKAMKQQQLAGDAYDSFKNYQNTLRLKDAYDKIHADPSRVANNPYFSPPGEAWQKAPRQSLHTADAPKPWTLAHGVLQGGLGESGLGVPGHAYADPFTGKPMVERDPEWEGQARLSPDAAVRQAAYNDGEYGADADGGLLPDMVGEHPQASSQSEKLRKMGVNV